MVAISKLWNGITVPPSVLLFLVSLAEHVLYSKMWGHDQGGKPCLENVLGFF